MEHNNIVIILEYYIEYARDIKTIELLSRRKLIRKICLY